MMKKLLFLFTGIFMLYCSVTAQCSFTAGITPNGPVNVCGSKAILAATPGNTWTAKSGFTGMARAAACGFSIGNKGYIATGNDGASKNDVWEYDPAADAWTQKADFGGMPRFNAVSFGIGTKGYLGTGINTAFVNSVFTFTYCNDFWEYDPAANTWTAKANFPGAARTNAAGFGIGSKGYIGTGYDGTVPKKDFYEYDPATDTWTVKASLTGTARAFAYYFSIGAKGYIGGGNDAGSSYRTDFWEYDPTGNTWTSKTALPDLNASPACFSIGNKGYVASGYTGSAYLTTLYEYDAFNNIWNTRAVFPAAGRNSMPGFSIAGKAYVGTGRSQSNSYLSDFYEYTPPLTYSWSTGAITPTISAIASGAYSVTVTGATGCTATASQTLNLLPLPQLMISGATQVCAGSSTTLTASGANSYTWSGGISNGVGFTPGATTTYTVSGTLGTCTTGIIQVVQVNPLAAPVITPGGPTTICGTNVTLSTSVNSGNVWTAKAGLPGATTRYQAVGFSIGSNGYVGTGYNTSARDEFWIFDPVSNVWGQVASYPGGPRTHAFGFSIGNKGYVGTGSFTKDFYEYDPATNTWTAKANYPGGNRQGTVAFATGSKGYVGLGYNGASYFDDFYEYDPFTDTWTAKATFGGTGRYGSFGFTVGNKGYVGGGYDGTAYRNDFYEYDPASDLWTAKASLAVTNHGGTGFSIGAKGYVATGYNGIYSNSFLEYDPSLNTWITKPSFSGGARNFATGFSINGKGYIGTGKDASTGKSDFFEYAPAVTYSWSTGSIAPSITVTSSSTYSLSLSSALGCPATTSQTVGIFPIPVLTVNGVNSVCAGGSVTLTATGATTYTWSGGISNGVGFTPGATAPYTVIGSAGNCTAGITKLVSVNPLPSPTITPGGPTTICGTSVALAAISGNTWVSKTSVSGGGRSQAVGFSIGSKGYIGTGNNGTLAKDLWEYNPAANTWTQKSNFPGSMRGGAVGFSIGAKGYIGTGNSSSYYESDFWEYDPVANTWVQKAYFAGSGRSAAVGFSIGNKGYIGTGYDGASRKNDFYEYDPVTNAWTQKASFAGVARYDAVGFSIGNKGYIGAGGDMTIGFKNDFWEYDPASDTWTTKANFPAALAALSAFSIANKAYVGLGYNASISPGNLYEFNPVTNIWTPIASISTAPRRYGVGFSIAGKGYIGTGSDNSALNDFYEYTPSYTYSWSTGSSAAALTTTTSGTYSLTIESPFGCSASGSQTVSILAIPTIAASHTIICTGNSAVIAPTGADSYTISGNSFTVSPPTTTSYTITGTGSNGCAASNTVVAFVNVNVTPTITANSATICSGKSATITSGGAGTYTISGGTFTVNPATNSNYTITGTSASGCAAINTVVSTVSVNITPTLSINNATICSGAQATLIPQGALNYFITGSNFIVSPVVTTTYVLTGNSNNCVASNSVVATVSVNASPTISVNNATVCSGATVTFVPVGAATYSITGNTFTVTPANTTSYSVTGTGTNNCVSLNPFVATVSVNITPTLSINNATICTGRQATLIPTGAGSYTITGNSFVVNPLTTTSYSVTGTGTNNCAASNTVISTVSVNITPTVSANSATICSGNQAIIAPTGAVTYTITGGIFTVSPAATTSYSVTGTATNNCVSDAFVSTVSVNITPTLSVNSATMCPGNSATLVPTGAATYTITGGNFTVSPAATTSYSVTGTATNNCVSGAFVSTVSVYITPTLLVNNATICSGNTLAIVPTGAATYTITGGNFTVTPLTTTSYSVSGTSAAGCISAGPAVSQVSVNATPTIAVNSGSICSGNSFIIIPSGTNAYTVTGGSFTVSPASTRSYSVTGTGTNGCISTGQAVSTVTVYTTPTVAVNSGSVCSGKSFTIIPSGTDTYTITGGNYTVTPLTTASYSVTGTSTAGCVALNTATSTVTVYTTPTLTVNSASICSGNSVVITPSGSATYSITGNNFTVTPLVTTGYSITGTSTAGCISSNTIVSTVTVYATPTLAVNNATICSNASVVITPGGANTYTITGNNFTVTPLTTTSYSVTGTSTAGCISAGPAVSQVSVNATPSLAVNSGSICSNNSFVIVPSGANTYTVTGNNFTVTPLTTTSYSVTGTGTNNCVSASAAVANVTVNATPTLVVNSGSICSNNLFVIVPSGANTYTVTGNNFTVTPLTTTSYSVTGTSTAGCVSANPALSQVSVNALPAITISGSTIVCAFSTNNLSASGAVTYVWNEGQTNATIAITPSVNTSYTVTGTDANGCVNTANVAVTADPCTGISKNNSSLIFGVYPNPNHGEFVVETTENAEVVVLNSLGQLVHSEKTASAKTAISIDHLANGIYFVKVIVNGSQQVVKIIKE